MATRSKLTVESLSKLGAVRLAEILIEEAGRNRQLKLVVQMALAAESGSTEVGHQIRNRLAQIGRSGAFVSSGKARELATENENGVAITHIAADLLRCGATTVRATTVSVSG